MQPVIDQAMADRHLAFDSSQFSLQLIVFCRGMCAKGSQHMAAANFEQAAADRNLDAIRQMVPRHEHHILAKASTRPMLHSSSTRQQTAAWMHHRIKFVQLICGLRGKGYQLARVIRQAWSVMS